MKLGDLKCAEQLLELRETLPRAEPEEVRDPAGVALRHLMELHKLCQQHQSKLPRHMQDAVKATTAALGRVK
jgi:hypothetical protein